MKKRNVRIFFTRQPDLVKQQALTWAQSFDHFHYFNPNHFDYPYSGFAHLLAAGYAAVCPLEAGNTFGSLQQFFDQNRDWLIGFFSYDVKNEIEALHSRHPDGLAFPTAYFYVPLHLIHFKADHLVIESFTDPEEIFQQIIAAPPANENTDDKPAISIQQRTSKEKYLQHVAAIQNHILEGDVYEMNYCMEFYGQQTSIDPLQTYLVLNKKSPMPFSVFGRTGERYVLCASPERFLKKTTFTLISQPIKGTARRGSSAAEDAAIIQQLRYNEKEMAENMMIVDLVRNDLARSAQTGSIKVEEMFGVYTFPQLHQMISTVSAQLRPDIPFTEAIKHAFPMGSMTGAPKIMAMQLIEQYEEVRRGLYSGTVGYITPDGDFDFNVVIRSILYHTARQYLSFQVGSAITFDAEGEQEYEECLLKAKAMLEVFAGHSDQNL